MRKREGDSFEVSLNHKFSQKSVDARSQAINNREIQSNRATANSTTKAYTRLFLYQILVLRNAVQ